MRRRPACLFLACVLLAAAADQPAPITIDYPEAGSIFPPEITAPTFLWRDPTETARRWRIEVEFGDGVAAIRAETSGERLRIAPMDPRTVARHQDEHLLRSISSVLAELA